MANLGVFARVLNLAIAIGCLATLLIAFRLTPKPGGVGTHTALKMQECAWLYRIGIPCPSCGMTTSFSWYARGNIAASVYVQPFGFVLALIVTIVFWVSLYAAISAKAVTALLDRLSAKYTWGTILILAMGAWAWKIFIHVRKIDGWQ